MHRQLFNFSHPHSPINKVENLARAIDVEQQTLTRNSEEYLGRYKEREIKKKNGGVRNLTIPNDELKGIQRRINQRILSHVHFPFYVFGGIKAILRGTDYIDVCHHHAGAWIKAELDIDSFFPSVSEEHVKNIFENFFKFPPAVSSILVSLCTRFDQLPQGSPTSVALANLVFFDKEPKLVYTLFQQGDRYSRFIDDIAITHPDRSATVDTVRKKVERMVESSGFSCNQEKTVERETAFHGLKIFGFLISSREARITAKDVKKIRGMIQRLEKQAKIPNARKTDTFKRSWDKISGQLNKLKRLSHPKYQSYRIRMRKILPLLNESKIKSVVKAVEIIESGEANVINFIAFRRFFYKTRSRIGVLARTHPEKAEDLRVRMRGIQKKHNL